MSAPEQRHEAGEAAVQAYLHHLEVERGLARNTLASYGSDLRHLLQFLKGRRTAIVATGSVVTTIAPAIGDHPQTTTSRSTERNSAPTNAP